MNSNQEGNLAKMLKNQHILCVSFPNWSGDYMKTIVQVMSRVGAHNKVLYVDYEFTWKDVFMSLFGKQKLPLWRVLGLKNRIRKEKIEDNKHVYVLSPPPVLPINFIKNKQLYSKLMSLNAWWVKRSIQKGLKRLKMSQPIVINAFNPFYGLPLAGKFNESMLVYYCYDEINAAAWSKNHGKWIEHAFIQKTDAVITTSKGLLQCKSEITKNCFLVKNGVDFKAFSAGKQTTTLKPQKVVGYVGSIDDRLDLKLLTEVIQHTPDLDFHFVGRVMSNDVKDALNQYSNVTFFGSKKPQELPDIIANFDVGIIPFIVNEFTKNIYPLKINEYLALGKGVVMTSFGQLEEFHGQVSLADDPVTFKKALLEEIAISTPQQIKIRKEIAASNSWENRVHELGSILQELLKKKHEEAA